MKDTANIEQLVQLDIDWMGMIFYPQSPRFITSPPQVETRLFQKITKVGVFVNANNREIISTVNRFSLDIIQLHGNESVQQITALRSENPRTKIIKAFSILHEGDLNKVQQYETAVDYALLDTKTHKYGGSGEKFDWSIINHYQSELPFILSGGIDIDDTHAIKSIQHSKLAGIDINSRFEISPGIKNISKIQELIQKIR